MAHIRLYHPSDAGEVVSLNLRQADVDEIVAATGLTPSECLEYSIESSEYVWVIIHDMGHIVGVFGLSSTKDINGNPVGVPWLLSTDDLKDFRYAFSKYSWGVVEFMSQQYNYLTNYVDSRHKQAIKWLKWLGFTIHADIPITLHDKAVTFYRFSMVKYDPTSN